MNTIKTEIYRDGKLLHTFHGENSPNEAFYKLLRIQSNSTTWAIKYEGYRVAETMEDGSISYWENKPIQQVVHTAN